MQFRELGKTGFRVSAVAYGGIVSAFTYDGIRYDQYLQADSDRYVAWAIEKGVNYFDVAPTYGDAQTRLGESLLPYRKDVYLAVKTTCRDYAGAEKEMRESLRLLQTDHFDVYQMHGLNSVEEVDRAFGPGGCMELIRDMKEKGITRKLGFTAHNEEAALKALALYDFDTVLFPFNWHMNMAYGMGDRLLRVCREKNVGVLCMKSMIERAWDDRRDADARKQFPKSWCKPFDPEKDRLLLLAAMKYALALGVDTLVPPGNYAHFSFAAEHIDEALQTPLSDEERTLLREHLEEVRYAPFFSVK